MADVLVVGSYNAGFTIYTSRLPLPGETVGDGRFNWGPGGKGANQAVALRRLGVDTCFVTKLGEDVFGDHGRRVLLSEGLPERGILIGTEPTGVAFIIVQEDGENSIVVAPGANLELALDDLSALGDEVASCRLVLLQLECRAELAIDVARWARDARRSARNRWEDTRVPSLGRDGPRSERRGRDARRSWCSLGLADRCAAFRRLPGGGARHDGSRGRLQRGSCRRVGAWHLDGRGHRSRLSSRCLLRHQTGGDRRLGDA